MSAYEPRWITFFGAPGAPPAEPASSEEGVSLSYLRPPVHMCRGGKGASLAAMSEAGLPVPPGFTLCVDCCRHYHDNDGRWPEGLEDLLRENMARLEKVTGRMFGQGPEPLLVSVRSGAAVSMPGMMDTILNCGLHPGLAGEMADEDAFWRVYGQFVTFFGRTVAGIAEEAFEAAAGSKADPKAAAEAQLALYHDRTGRDFPDTPWATLTECINAVFGSWNNERALIYRRSHDIRGLYGTAVNVQSMFPSEVSGIAFTANPADASEDEIVIESSWGLGEAIVSGMVTPDRFVVDRASLEIKDRVLGEKGAAVAAIGGSPVLPAASDAASLTDEQVAEVARISLKVEEYFGFPVDIEWGIAGGGGGKLALLQSRRVRGLDIARDVEAGRLEEIARLKRIAGEARKVWVVHNLSETLPAPTPLTWEIQRRYMSAGGGYGRLYTDLGYRPSRRAREEGFLELICGRIYADPERAPEFFWEGMPKEYDLDELREDPSLIESAPTKFAPEKADPGFLLRAPGLILASIRSWRLTKRARSRAVENFNAALDAYLEYVKAERARDIAGLATEAVLEELAARIAKVLDGFGPESLKPGFFGGMALTALEESLVQLFGELDGRELCRTLTSGLEGDSTVEQNAALFEVARGGWTLDEFRRHYGHRGLGEVELSEPRWREDDTYLARMVETYRGEHARSPAELHAANRTKREAVEAGLPARLAEVGGSSFLEELMELAREAQTLLPFREIGKDYLMMGYELIRAAVMELSRRWDLGRDVFFLTLDELARFESERDALLPKIAARKLRWLSAKRLDHPGIIDTDELDRLGMPRELESASEMKAVPLASGIAEGTARIVFSPAEAGDLGTDCILVCPSTDPAWTALFVNIIGLVVERGGVLSHGAITARDFGIPAVACADATKLIEAGARVRVDGDRGQVTIVSEGGES